MQYFYNSSLLIQDFDLNKIVDHVIGNNSLHAWAEYIYIHSI